jgi:PPK2 family polyphosphate:nucleotide phosphotransferase
MTEINLNKINTKADADIDKKKTKEKTVKILEEINELQNLLYAENKHSLLVILQGMDASGKDGVIRNIFGHLNPQGVTVKSFKAPSSEELNHDFLWRIQPHAPAQGMIQIFNRSHYEDIVITRVHKWCDDETAAKRITAINNWEELLTQHNNTHILKFYLHISHEEQLERLEERKTNPTKMWKYNENDYKEREFWDIYKKYYEEAFASCNLPPWNIIPSDQNWYKEYLISNKVLDTLKNLDMKFPEMNPKESK